jgi:competence protein ComFC
MSVMESVIGWLAPPVCLGCGQEGKTLCLACSNSEIISYGERCWRCNALSPRAKTCKSCRGNGSPLFVWINTDYDGLAKDIVQKYKFGHQRVASQSLAELMAQTFLHFNTTEDVRLSNYLVVPVPTATSRVRQRGFDHAALLAQCVAQKLKLPTSKALGRLGQSRQLGTSRSERLKQTEGKYFIRNPAAIAGRNILIIDDVVTTGATLQEVAKTLRKAGAHRVDALVFAKRL